MKSTSLLALGLASSAAARSLVPGEYSGLAISARSKSQEGGDKKGNSTTTTGGSSGGSSGGKAKGNSTAPAAAAATSAPAKTNGTKGGNGTLPVTADGAPPLVSVLSGSGGIVTIAGLGIAFAVFM